MLGIALVPVLGYLGLLAWATVEDAFDERRWHEVRAAAVSEHDVRTDAEIDAAGSTWALTGTWPLPLPDGVRVLGFSGVGDAELVLVSTDLASERCLLLAFDDEGLRVDNDISSRAYRASPG
ncbi:hypothetical protein B7486_54280 [cyanobacterium TDX16]|nr:hypothetical protein B7486_54280 [cyanobacterium TDX16]